MWQKVYTAWGNTKKNGKSQEKPYLHHYRAAGGYV